MFYSDPDLVFDPGTLIENLVQGDPGDPGTVGGTKNSVLTVDENGLGLVRMALGEGPRAFIRAQTAPPPPPLLSENFDAVAGLPEGWSASAAVNGTVWEVGTPSSVTSGPAAASSEPYCAGTNIDDFYTENTGVSLISPAIAISAGSGAILSFRQLIDTDNAGDAGSVRVLDADNADAPIAGLEITGIQGSGSSGGGDGWTGNNLDLPAVDVGGKNIRIEFRFVSDAGTAQNSDVYAGFYIDDVQVEVGP